MGLQTAIKKAAQTAIKATGDIAETITYTSRSTGSYNTSTGAVSHTDTDYTLNAIVANFGSASQGSKRGEVRPEHSGNLSVTFASNDLAVTPDTNDLVTRGLTKYKVTQIISDPAGATYRLIIGKLG